MGQWNLVFASLLLLVAFTESLPVPFGVGATELLPDSPTPPLFRSRLGSRSRLRHSRHLGDRPHSSGGYPDSYHFDDLSSNSANIFPLGGSRPFVVQENHKPVFSNCSHYQPVVKEEEAINTYVFTVQAYDRDPIENGGKITYTFVSSPGERLKFNIDPETGEITTRHMFDRDEPSREKEVYLTIRATDNGRPQLDDVCTVKVTIQDINDNPPVFDKVSYMESVPQDLLPGREVMRISATDIDDGNNSIVAYSIEPRGFDDKQIQYFRVDEKTGVIFLDRAIDRDPGYKFRLKATATDRGDIPNIAKIDLDILVVESNKKAPVFTAIPASPIILQENFTDFSYNIATLTAMSNDEKAPVFELVVGRTEQTNKLSTFRLESDGNTAHIRLARRMDFESIAEYMLTIRIQNKYNLAAETSINIQLEDVNDNIPAFTEVVSGVVLENEPPGTPVMQVRAIDADSTTAHNQVTYELADNQENFAIDRYTGNITTLRVFDREEQDFYNIKVIATDNSPSALFPTGEHNQGQQVFRIEIADKNDHPPRFTQSVYVAEAIPEDANINARVTQVNALDNDTASPVTYSITEGNENDAFFIDEKTGEIRVKNHLDYETKTTYTLKVRAFDGAYEDNCRVEIKIENVNDNPPVFYPYQNNITITEEDLIPGCIAQLEAYDPDIPDRHQPQHIVYFVVKQEQQKLLTIDKKGCLSLIKPLDRDPPDGFEIWQVLIAADDEDGGQTSLRATTAVVITLTDINDNKPFLDIPQPVIWRENQHPGIITSLVAKDYDGPENGAPFTFGISHTASIEIQTKFSVQDATLRATTVFDREEKKSYMVPIAITDSGIPSQTGTSTLVVVIGDENDNPMKEGYSEIFVYNYKGEAPDTEIGRVYVEDPDDWDLNDKHFLWAESPPNNFDLSPRTGMITMLQGTYDMSYLLHFTVVEKAPKVPEHNVSAVVNVTVKEIPEEAVDKSGSIRLGGITAEQFVEPNSHGVNKHSILRTHLAKFLNVSEQNVDVFTVLHSPHNTNMSQLDVRFSAHGSPYYSPEKLNAAVSAHNAELENALGATILMVNIDECIEEKKYCPEGSCTNFLNKSPNPSPVYTNTTTFVGVKAVVDPLCRCELPQRAFCHNGGTLTTDDRCLCVAGFEGPRCEILSIGFNGNGWALYPAFEACSESHMSFEMRTTKSDGLVFYIGPTKPSRVSSIQDFMSFELFGGYPILLVDFGTGTVRLDPESVRMDDGQFHRVDIFWSKTTIELQIDYCKKPSCLCLKLAAGPNEYLNVNGPLQLGGSFVDLQYLEEFMKWNYTPSRLPFTGCLRNLTFNGKYYNLGAPGYSKNVDIGCNAGVAVAISFGIDISFLIAILICLAILLILLLAVVVHRRKTDDLYKDTDDIRENIINYEDEGGGEGDMTAYDLNVLRLIYDAPEEKHRPEQMDAATGGDEVPDIHGFLDGKKQSVDNDPETNPFDDVRHYAYEGDGNTSGSLSSLASGTDEGDLNFDYLSNFGPRFRKLADMYGEDSSEEEDEDTYQGAHGSAESWC